MFFESRLIYQVPASPPPISSAPTSSPIDGLSDSFVDLDKLQETPSKGDRLVQSVLGPLSSNVIIFNNELLPGMAKELSHKDLALLLKDALTQLGLEVDERKIAEVQGEALKNFLQFVLDRYYGEIMTDLPPNLHSSITVPDLREWALRKTNGTGNPFLPSEKALALRLIEEHLYLDVKAYYNSLIDYAKADPSERNTIENYLTRTFDKTKPVNNHFYDVIENLTEDEIAFIESQKQFNYLHVDLVDESIIRYANPDKILQRFYNRVLSSESSTKDLSLNLYELNSYLGLSLEVTHFQGLDTNVIEEIETELEAASRNDELIVIAGKFLDFSEFNNGISQKLFTNYLNSEEVPVAKVFLQNLIQKMPQHPQVLSRVSVERHNTPIGLHTQKIIQLKRNPVLVSGYNLYELLSYSNVRQNPIITSPSIRQQAITQLIRNVYQDSDFGNDLQTMVDRAGDSTELSNPYVSQLAKYLSNVEHQLTVYNTFNRPGKLDVPLAGLGTLLRMIDTMSENNLLVTSASIMATTNVILKSDKMGKAISVLAVMGALPLLLKDDSKDQIMLAYHKESLSSIINKEFYTETEITKEEQDYFPYFIKNLLINTDFTSKSWGSFEDFVKGTNRNFINGDSTLPKLLRELGPADNMYKYFLSIMQKLYRRICTQHTDLKRDSNFLEVALVWIADDPILSKIPDFVNIDLTNTIANVPRAPISEVPRVLPSYVNDMNNQLSEHLVDYNINPTEQLYKHLNYDLTDGSMTLANVSPIYGQMFLDANRTFTFESNTIRGLSKSVPDSIGNRYYNFHFQSGFTDADRLKINQLCIEKVKEEYSAPFPTISIVYNTVSSRDSAGASTAGDVGIIVRPNDSISNELSRIQDSPIMGSTVAQSFLQSADMDAYSPVIRLLDSMLPSRTRNQSRASQILFTDTVDKVINTFSRIGSVFGNYTTELSNFWTSYNANPYNNTTLHGKIMGALTNYIQNGPGTTLAKRKRINEISEFSGLRLYYEIINSTFQNSGETTETTKAERAFVFIKELDAVRDQVLDEKSVNESRHALIKSQMNYLQLLLGLCISDVESPVARKIYSKLKIEPTGNPRQTFIDFYKHQLTNMINGTDEPFNALDDLANRAFSDIPSPAYNRKETANITFDRIQDSKGFPFYKVFIDAGAKITGDPAKLEDLREVYPGFIDDTGKVIRSLPIVADQIQGLTVAGRLRITRNSQDYNPTTALPQHCRTIEVPGARYSFIFVPQYTDELKPIKLVFIDDSSSEYKSGNIKSPLLEQALAASAHMVNKNIAFVLRPRGSGEVDQTFINNAREKLFGRLNANNIERTYKYITNDSTTAPPTGLDKTLISSTEVDGWTTSANISEFLNEL